MAENPATKLKASIEAQRIQREAAVATSLKVSKVLDEEASKATESEPEK